MRIVTSIGDQPEQGSKKNESVWYEFFGNIENASKSVLKNKSFDCVFELGLREGVYAGCSAQTSS